MRKTTFIDKGYYHIYNRGVDKRTIFCEKADYFRFLHDLFELNDADAVLNVNRRCAAVEEKGSDKTGCGTVRKTRKLLVDIISFCLMKNHFHLILQQIQKKGVELFMHKLGTGYTMYFNRKYSRKGSLFEGPYESIEVKTDEYITHLSRYIHLNPIEIIEPKWKTGGIKNSTRAKQFLKDYRWSSYQDYIGIKNYPSITNRKFLLEFFSNPGSYEGFVCDYLTDHRGDKLDDGVVINDIILED